MQNKFTHFGGLDFDFMIRDEAVGGFI